MAQEFKTNEEKENYYSELKAAAESGWDFSSRWFIVNATNKGKRALILPQEACCHWRLLRVESCG